MGETHLFNKSVSSFPKEVTSVMYRVLFVCLFSNISDGNFRKSLIFLITKNPIRDQGESIASFFEYLPANVDEQRGNSDIEVLRKMKEMLCSSVSRWHKSATWRISRFSAVLSAP